MEANSAGSHPKPMHPNAVRVLRDELSVDPASPRAEALELFVGQRFDWVISLCDRVRALCPSSLESPGPSTGAFRIPPP